MIKGDISVQVENISKCYRIGLKQEMHDTLAMAMFSVLKSPLKNYRKYRSLYEFSDIESADQADLSNVSSDMIWALKDVSFEVRRGEVVGIIGFNGAGKSTLLKILSKITVPTCGRAIIRGRVSSLLEVGTGFHPELTGRENTYLNGAMLGMKKREIDDKFDEIVEFSGVAKFIDTPVKRYSSGMRVRLAFAVAAHLEAEILFIDEVLAVGDARFQKKCVDKMQDVRQQGRTVLFVSHSMSAVTRLCPRAILLADGKVQADDLTPRVVSVYMSSEKAVRAEREWPDLRKAPGDEVIRLCAVRVKTKESHVTEVVDIGEPVGIEVEYEVLQPGQILMIYYHVFNEAGIEVFMAFDNDSVWRKRPRQPGRYVSTSWIPGNLLAEGILFIGPSIRTLNPEIRRLRVNDAVAFHVVDRSDGSSARVDCGGEMSGVVRPLLKWETRFRSNQESSYSLG
jgi:lipopolysaccharide transport system ATP-binding protein